MTKLGSIKVLSIRAGGPFKLSKRRAPSLSAKARRKIRKAENVRAEIARKAPLLRLG